MDDSRNQEDLSVIADILDGDENLVVSLDIDNPVKEPGPHMEPHNGVLEGISDLIDQADAVTFNSGKPVDYQRELREEYTRRLPELDQIDLIGGMGTVAEIEGELYHFGGEPDEALLDFLDVKTNILSVLAENGWKANMQNNRSYDVGVTRVEAENGKVHSRGHSRANPLFSDRTTHELYLEYFEDADGFEIVDDYDREQHEGRGGVLFQPAQDNVSYLSEVARVEEPFIGLRFERTDEGIVFYRDSRDLPVNEGRVRTELEQAIEASDSEWEVEHHGDGGTEYWKPGIGKEHGLERYLDIKFGEDARAIHIGDSESDWIDSDRITTLPQYGTDLYEMMEPEHDLKPGDVADFSDLMARAASGREPRY